MLIKLFNLTLQQKKPQLSKILFCNNTKLCLFINLMFRYNIVLNTQTLGGDPIYT